MLGEGVKKLLDKAYPASSINETTYRTGHRVQNR
jgi:hypothetical protein